MIESQPPAVSRHGMLAGAGMTVCFLIASAMLVSGLTHEPSGALASGRGLVDVAINR